MRITSLKLSTLALALMAFAFVPSASATSCPTGDTCFNLSGSNIGITGSIGFVDVTNVSGGVQVTITMDPGYLLKTTGGDIAFNLSSGSITKLNGISFNKLSTNQNISQFGNYDFDIQNIKGQGTAVNTITFTILGTNLTASDFTGFAVHFCVQASPTSCTQNTGFTTGTPTSPVPEPGTLGLLGTGLVGLAGIVRRRVLS